MKSLLIFILLCFTTLAWADIDINMSEIAYIEGSNNPLAYNKYSQAIGLYQITPICLKDYNQFHTKKYKLFDLYNPLINYEVSSWYLLIRIPQMLVAHNFPLTTENILACYSAGINYLILDRELPEETKEYIKKYNK